MYPVISDSLFRTNTLIIGDRNCGKTTFLKQIINQAINTEFIIIVFDSATEHVEKSIIEYCKKIFDKYLEIKSPEKEYIECQNEEKQFPYDILKEKQSSQIYLFDVSRYLEESFVYKADNPMRGITRLLYKKLVIQCLAIMYEFLHHSKCIVIMDEIEFFPGFEKIVKKYNEKGVYFINCLHTEESCNDEIKQLFKIRKIINVFPTKLGVICKKDKKMLCGSACLHYLLNIVLKKEINIPNDFVWITDIAKFLSELNIEHELSCFESNLYNDYIKGKLPKNHPAYLSIRNYLTKKNGITIKQFTQRDIIYNRLIDTFFIASVKSKLLDNMMPEDSYHYILVHQNMDIFTIICPRKKDYYKKSMPINKFVQMINESGNWIIKIKKVKE